MNCPQCRSVLPAGSQFCPSCGYRFPAQPAQVAYGQQPASPPPYGQPPAPPAYGQPQPAYGQPAAAPAYGQPAAQAAYGQSPAPTTPAAQPPAYGQPQAAPAYAQPQAAPAYAQPQAAPAYGQPAAGYAPAPAAYGDAAAAAAAQYGQALATVANIPSGITFGAILSNALKMGLKNAPSILGAVVLWALTCWIPYLNVGTTIGLICLAAKMGRGGVVSPVEIFNGRYRRRMGEFFLVQAFVMMGTTIGMLFMYIPAIVIGIAWMLAPLLVVDKGLSPMDAIKKSNDLTYGKKLIIFLAVFVIMLILMVATGILSYLGGLAHQFVSAFFSFVGFIIMVAVMFAVLAYVYNTLTAGMPSEEA
jgi:hypothetical protein